MREFPLAHNFASPVEQAHLVLCRAPVDAGEPVYCLVSHGPVLSCHVPRAVTTPAGTCMGARGRDFLLGIRRGQSAGAQIHVWCSWHECTDDRSRQTGSHDQLTLALIVPFPDTGARIRGVDALAPTPAQITPCGRSSGVSAPAYD